MLLIWLLRYKLLLSLSMNLKHSIYLVDLLGSLSYDVFVWYSECFNLPRIDQELGSLRSFIAMPRFSSFAVELRRLVLVCGWRAHRWIVNDVEGLIIVLVIHLMWRRSIFLIVVSRLHFWLLWGISIQRNCRRARLSHLLSAFCWCIFSLDCKISASSDWSKLLLIDLGFLSFDRIF